MEVRLNERIAEAGRVLLTFLEKWGNNWLVAPVESAANLILGVVIYTIYRLL
jgi:hypothetical protein